MPLEPGRRLGVFEILAPLGKGGMGEVYRARDTKLEREVAVKILPEEMANRPERMARFEREAKLLAALDHPHIAAIHGLHAEDGQHFLVMELVDGQTLADRLKRGPLPILDALELGRQIAEALEAAHEKDIIHRDLKPSNVMLTSKGRAKVLDFGLARIIEREALSSSGDTETTPDETGTGVVIGTAPYMSPEQARGEDVNQRTDIWSFGCVLFEMLSGKRAFPGGTTSDAIAAVLEHEPEWEALPEAAGPIARSLLRQCLRKDKARRLRDIADARIEIEEALAAPVGNASKARLPARRSGLRLFGALLLAAAVGGLVGQGLGPPTPDTNRAAGRVSRNSISLPPEAPLGGQPLLGFNPPRLTISPDGAQVVYVGAWEGGTALFHRKLASFEVSRLSGTEGAIHPFFSPDGRWVGFLTNNRVKKVSLRGDPPLTLTNVATPIRAVWPTDDTIYWLFVGSSG